MISTESLICKLQDCFNKKESYLLLFSGGFDSSAVLGVLKKAQINVKPIWVDNGMNRMAAQDVQIQASVLGAENLEIIQINPDSKTKANPVDRCYVCKLAILKAVADRGLVMLDGTNASDSKVYRPGSKALKEMKVQSPLMQCGIDGPQAKEIALALGARTDIAGLESCLATRINYNLEITEERITTIRDIERYIINKTEDYTTRCRMDSLEHLRIEITSPDSFALLSQHEHREKLSQLNNLTTFLTMDLKPYRLNEHDKKI
ncbi:MAG: exoenzyme S synthesis protein B [Phycisphaerae bacterium]|nr:exoenzyme S synthesis protein B [Phycisphaerae bacterium]